MARAQRGVGGSSGSASYLQAANQSSRVEWSGVEWSGVEWSGVEWNRVEWSGVEWSGVEWSQAEPIQVKFRAAKDGYHVQPRAVTLSSRPLCD